MGYATMFTGEIHVDPPLNEAEREYLRQFSESRRMASPLGLYALDPAAAALKTDRPPADQPGWWCPWVPSEDGSRLVWDGHEKIYRSSDWMSYLIDTFLRSGARVQRELEDPMPGRVYPEGLQQFTFNHSMYGTVLAMRQDGASWRIEVGNNEVTVVETSGPAPSEFVLFVLRWATLFELDREFDAAFDLR
ncbi:hypothetical protein [Prescottella equi]|uniref:hypothetical protein n=1 Tax=Rhodococcus hoagii TaxID=43767 RepID=UPI001EE9FD67|nr:hypothetical protein [Prescottella equi]